MKVVNTNIPDVIRLRPEVYEDPRGIFMETYREAAFREQGILPVFVQDNLVHSRRKVFRGLHFQLPPFAQAKLITLISGEILDIALDLRRDSTTFLQQVQITLSAKDHDQLYIPAGFAHGYWVLSSEALIAYKVSVPYAPDHQAGIRWDDPQLGLGEIVREPLLSAQDRRLPSLNEILSNDRF
ncbi:MAG: dTDP-4-dehydrorhamnose 3,5-epimerase [Candidatus Marinimicrobia bacterium]|nr:dTDP-4-dehydrorhamnose 3,5-epimerase [Candidatus Neomarinimicrobiota bacterium]